MENQTDSKSIIINNGLLLGGISVIISLGLYAMGQHLQPHWSTSLVSMAAFILLITMGIKKFRESNRGFISWAQAVKIGVGIAVIAGLIGAVYQYVFTNFIEPDFINQMMEIQNQKLLDEGVPEEQIEAANEMSKSFSSPALMAAFGIIGSAIGGFIVSAIAGAIMKKSEENDY